MSRFFSRHPPPVLIKLRRKRFIITKVRKDPSTICRPVPVIPLRPTGQAKTRKNIIFRALPIMCFISIIHHLTKSSPLPDMPCVHLSVLALLFQANVRAADQPLPGRPEEVFCLSSLDIFGYQPLQPEH